MKIYGQDVTDLLVFASDLMVECDAPDLVQMSTGIGHVAFLTLHDVTDLIEQLSVWVATNAKGER